MNIEIWYKMQLMGEEPRSHLYEQHVAESPIPTEVPRAVEFTQAVQTTTRAVRLGMAIAAIDGPIPVMDAVGFGVASVMTLKAWYEFFD